MVAQPLDEHCTALACEKRDTNRTRPFQCWLYDRRDKQSLHLDHCETEAQALALARTAAAVAQIGNGLTPRQVVRLSRAIGRDQQCGQLALRLGDEFDDIAAKVDAVRQTAPQRRSAGRPAALRRKQGRRPL